MDTSELIGRIYESIGDPEAFADTLDAMRIATGSRAVQSALIEKNGLWVQATLIGYDPAILKAYVDYYASDDPRMRYSLSHPGRLVPCQEAAGDARAFERSPLVNELLDKGDARFAMATMFPVDAAHSILLCFMRARRDGRYGPDEIDGLFPVLPHLKRALALNIRLGRLESRLGSLTALVDRLAAPILLTDGAGVLLYANAPGQAELMTRSYLVLRNGRIEPREPRRLRRFAELVAAASSGDPIVEPSDPSGSMRLLDVEGKAAVLVVQGLRGQPRESGMPRAVVALFLIPPSVKTLSGIERLRVIFGLTPAEARLAERLIRGGSLGEISERFSVSRETLRTQLRSLFEKTDTHRQGELVARLLSSMSVSIV